MTTSLYFVELTVCDLDAAVDWYREVLGLREVMRDGANTFALLSAGGTKLALKRGTPSVGSVLLAFEVADLDAWVQALAGKGVALEDPIKTSHEGYRRARLRDADGYEVSVFEWEGERRDGVDAHASTRHGNDPESNQNVMTFSPRSSSNRRRISTRSLESRVVTPTTTPPCFRADS